MRSTLRSVKFLFTAPFILVLLAIINLVTSPGDWWIKWPAIGLGIFWFISLLRVLRAVVVVGGIAALGAWLMRRNSQQQPPIG
jgi:hypothetical protein